MSCIWGYDSTVFNPTLDLSNCETLATACVYVCWQRALLRSFLLCDVFKCVFLSVCLSVCLSFRACKSQWAIVHSGTRERGRPARVHGGPEFWAASWLLCPGCSFLLLFLPTSPSRSAPPLWPLVQLSLVLDLTMCRRLHKPHMVPSSTRDRWTHSNTAWHSGIQAVAALFAAMRSEGGVL